MGGHFGADRAQSPMVDVVLCTNRQSSFLPIFLDSLLAQTFRDWRLVVVDDGCPDHAALVSTISRVPGAVILRKGANGLPAARNIGLAAGSSPYVAFADDDDVWEPEKLTRQVEALQANPRALAAFTAGRFIRSDGKDFGGWSVAPASSSDYLRGEVPLPRIVTLMITRAATRLVGPFNESYSVGEDLEFILRLARAGSLVPIDLDLVRYRRHASNMSQEGDLAGRIAGRRVLKELRNFSMQEPDTNTARLLREHLYRKESDWARHSVRALARAIASHDFAHAASEILWLLRSPRAAAGAIAFAARSKM